MFKQISKRSLLGAIVYGAPLLGLMACSNGAKTQNAAISAKGNTMSATNQSITATLAPFGTLENGQAVRSVLLSNGSGVKARIITLGATLQAYATPDRNGKVSDIVLGFDRPDDYIAASAYIGASVGRYANRIGGGKFTLDGKDYQLSTNDGDNHLHGGVKGYDKRIWKITDQGSGDSGFVQMSLRSPDGDEGYPGALDVTVRYTLDQSGALRIDYSATTDKTTIVNLTNHSYFNLAGVENGRSVLDHNLTIPAHFTTPVDGGLIPTGDKAAVAGTVFDFNAPRRIGDDIRDMSDEQIRFGRGYDHNWIVDTKTKDKHGMSLAAVLSDPYSGRTLQIKSTSPAIQFYSGNFIDGTITGKYAVAYRQGDGLCLEPQVYPDAPNKPDFPSARLEVGQVYTNSMVFIPSAK